MWLRGGLYRYSSAEAMSYHFRELVGCYRLVVSDELRAFVERAFVQAAPEPERDNVRREALAEAAAAELQIEADGTFISRAGAVEFYRVRLPVPTEAIEELTFEKAPGQTVRLRLVSPDSVLALQAGKPDALFERVN